MSGDYYVPEQSKLPILLCWDYSLRCMGAQSWLIGDDTGPTILFCGGLLFAYVPGVGLALLSMKIWQVKTMANSSGLMFGVYGFIFSEVMFFAAFFGALYYIRNFALPWLGGEGSNAATNEFLWSGFEAAWPLMTTPDMVVNGEAADVLGPDQSMSYGSVDSL